MTQQARRAGRRRRRRGRTRIAAVVLLLIALPLLWAAWQVTQGVRTLDQAADRLRALQSDVGSLGGGGAELTDVAERTRDARERFDDPIVRGLAALPEVGDPLAAASAVARAADVAVREALLPLVTAAGDDPAERLTSGPGALDVDYLASLAPPAEQARQTLARAQAELADAPADTVVDRVDNAVTELSSDLDQLSAVVDDLATALDVAPQLLGAQEPQRYLLVSQSPAEARGTGGLIGGYSLLEVTDGRLDIVRSGPRSELQSPGEPVVTFPEEYDQHYGGNGATRGWINSNLSPHFPYAAQIWQELWERQYGEQLDGALVLDPIALSYLLRATGPVTLPDGSQVTADNVVDLTLRDVYVRFGGTPAGDTYLQAISTSVAEAVTSRELDGRALIEALVEAVDERRLLLWHADDDVQAVLEDEAISGTLPEGRAVGDVVVDAAGSKLDYYLERELRYEEGCGAEPSTLTLDLTNAAPAQGLPDYVTPAALRGDDPAGTNRLILSLYVPPDSVIESVRVDGTDVAVRQGTERGLGWVELVVTLPPGGSSTVTAEFTEPDSDRPLERIAQPLVREETFTAQEC